MICIKDVFAVKGELRALSITILNPQVEEQFSIHVEIIFLLHAEVQSSPDVF